MQIDIYGHVQTRDNMQLDSDWYIWHVTLSQPWESQVVKSNSPEPGTTWLQTEDNMQFDSFFTLLYYKKKYIHNYHVVFRYEAGHHIRLQLFTTKEKKEKKKIRAKRVFQSTKNIKKSA
jgi:hypothetical protein